MTALPVGRAAGTEGPGPPRPDDSTGRRSRPPAPGPAPEDHGVLSMSMAGLPDYSPSDMVIISVILLLAQLTTCGAPAHRYGVTREIKADLNDAERARPAGRPGLHAR